MFLRPFFVINTAQNNILIHLEYIALIKIDQK